MNKFLTYTIALELLIGACVHFVIILTELQEVLSQELKCLCSKTTTFLLKGTIPKTMDMPLLHFYCIQITILCRNECTKYTNIHVPQIHEIYRVPQEECARLREGVPYVKVYRYNPKHLCPKLNGYGDNG